MCTDRVDFTFPILRSDVIASPGTSPTGPPCYVALDSLRSSRTVEPALGDQCARSAASGVHTNEQDQDQDLDQDQDQDQGPGPGP